MWELALIARDFDVRRQAIFQDIDRKEGPVWSQLYVICLSVIKAIEERIDNYGKPPTPPPAQPEVTPQQPPPRIVQPPRNDNVWAPAPAPKGLRNSVGKLINDVVTSPGKTPVDVYLPEAKKRALEATDRLLTKEQKEGLMSTNVNGLFQILAFKVISAPIIGPMFQQLFSRRLTTAVLGQPYGELSIYTNAAYALSKLAVSSLTEDRYGNVQRDVPALIRTFTVVIKKLERFHDTLPIHWTDLNKSRECAEVDELLDALKDGLGELIAAFEQYSSDLRLTRADMRLAKEAAVKKPKPAEAPVEQPRPVDEAGPVPRPVAAAGAAAGGVAAEANAQPEMQQLR